MIEYKPSPGVSFNHAQQLLQQEIQKVHKWVTGILIDIELHFRMSVSNKNHTELQRNPIRESKWDQIGTDDLCPCVLQVWSLRRMDARNS